MGDVVEEKLKYPKSVFFIVVNEFCERFTFYGLRTVLTLYFVTNLIYSDDDATFMYHAFVVLCYFFPLIGAIIADTWLGKFKTILYLSIIYCLGSIVLSISSSKFGSEEGVKCSAEEALSLLGLLLIAMGTGGIKPCVSAFGGDQFKLPEQEVKLSQFFSVFYFAINLGSLISTFITPIFRQDVKCFGENSCYPLAFGVPAAVMVVALVVFVVGKPKYKMVPPQGNVMLRVCGCIGSAVAGRKKRKDTATPDQRWIDYADQNKYNKELRDDVLSVLKVLVLALPLPFFWALYDQQGSRWTLQAEKMDGQLGSWDIKPDQMQVVNPVLILALLPIMEMGVYPLFSRYKMLRKPLQRMVAGEVLASLSFFISAILEWRVEATTRTVFGNELAQIRVFNVAPFPLTITSDSFGPVDLPEMAMHAELALKAINEPSLGLRVTGNDVQESKFNVSLKTYTARSVYLFNDNGTISLIHAPTNDVVTKIADVNSVVRFVYTFSDGKAHEIKLRDSQTKQIVATCSASAGDKFNADNEIENVPFTKYDVEVDGKVVLSKVFIGVSGTYSVLVNNGVTKVIASRQVSDVHMLWQIPQYIIISVAEVMFSVTGLHFFYTESPISMKSVISSIWLLTTAFGNLIVMAIAKASFFYAQVYEFILFASLMVVDTIFFLFLAIRYKYRDQAAGTDAGGNEAKKEDPGTMEKNNTSREQRSPPSRKMK